MKQIRTRRSRRLLTLLLAAVMTASMIPTAGAYMSSFPRIRSYEGFSDVSESAWYYNDVRNAYEMGLINGTENGFKPNEGLTLAQAITMACNVLSIRTGDDFVPGGTPWYQNAVAYAKRTGLISQSGYPNYDAKATRSDMAYIFISSLYVEDLPRINRVAWISDISDDDYIHYIYALYNAGILAGDDTGNFRPNDAITRAEAAAILTRLADPGKRVRFNSLTAAPGILVESDNGVLRMSVPAGHDWKMSSEEAGSDSTMTIYNAGASIEAWIMDKDSWSMSTEDSAESAARFAEEEGYTIDREIYFGWFRGLHAYQFLYSYTAGSGASLDGMFICVENDDYLVYMWCEIDDDASQRVSNDFLDILYTLDLSL